MSVHLNFCSILLGSMLALFSFSLLAQPDVEKQAAVDRYMRAVPMSKMLEDTYAEMAKQIPPEQRDSFIAAMRQIVRADVLEKVARSAMLKTFSTDELNALADFYSSKHGASAMAKFGPYMAEVMPPLMQEVQRAVQELQSGNKQ